MPRFLGYIPNCQPLFVLGERFKYDVDEEKNRVKRRKQKLRRQMKKEKETGKKCVDPILLAEVTKHEENLAKTG